MASDEDRSYAGGPVGRPLGGVFPGIAKGAFQRSELAGMAGVGAAQPTHREWLEKERIYLEERLGKVRAALDHLERMPEADELIGLVNELQVTSPGLR